MSRADGDAQIAGNIDPAREELRRLVERRLKKLAKGKGYNSDFTVILTDDSQVVVGRRTIRVGIGALADPVAGIARTLDIMRALHEQQVRALRMGFVKGDIESATRSVDRALTRVTLGTPGREILEQASRLLHQWQEEGHFQHNARLPDV